MDNAHTLTGLRGWQVASRAALLCISLWLAGPLVRAAEAVPAAQDPAIEARMLAIATELRCLVCQNQTIADSHADLAVDLRQQVREMLQKGQNEQQIMEYMTQRYGDFVLYRPPLKATTVLLWVGPAVMGLAGLVTLFVILRRRSRMAADQFDPEEPDAPQDPHLS